MPVNLCCCSCCCNTFRVIVCNDINALEVIDLTNTIAPASINDNCTHQAGWYDTGDPGDFQWSLVQTGGQWLLTDTATGNQWQQLTSCIPFVPYRCPPAKSIFWMNAFIDPNCNKYSGNSVDAPHLVLIDDMCNPLHLRLNECCDNPDAPAVWVRVCDIVESGFWVNCVGGESSVNFLHSKVIKVGDYCYSIPYDGMPSEGGDYQSYEKDLPDGSNVINVDDYTWYDDCTAACPGCIWQITARSGVTNCNDGKPDWDETTYHDGVPDEPLTDCGGGPCGFPMTGNEKSYQDINLQGWTDGVLGANMTIVIDPRANPCLEAVPYCYHAVNTLVTDIFFASHTIRVNGTRGAVCNVGPGNGFTDGFVVLENIGVASIWFSTNSGASWTELPGCSGVNLAENIDDYDVIVDVSCENPNP